MNAAKQVIWGRPKQKIPAGKPTGILFKQSNLLELHRANNLVCVCRADAD
jgi:hypothetical protein